VPDIHYAFSREKLMWRVNVTYNFNRMKQRQLFLRTGMTSKDIGNGGSINTFLNSVTTLFLKRNYLKLYEAKYLTLGYSTEIKNGMNIELSSNFEKRSVLENATHFSLLKTSREYTINTPVNRYLEAGANSSNYLSDQRHAEIGAKITFTPFQRYRIHDGAKIPRGSDWPTFRITWQHGFNKSTSSTGSYKQYNMIRFEASQSRETGAFSEFRWRVRAGGFLDNRNLSFYDFFHFNSQPVPLLLNNYEDAFMIPSYYSLSTPELFGEVHIKYTTPYFLLKLLPVLSNTLIRENLSLSYLGSRFNSNYTELGYSLSEVFLLAEAGIYVGFNDLKYKSIGAKLVLRFN
jgi:hypothetical protein